MLIRKPLIQDDTCLLSEEVPGETVKDVSELLSSNTQVDKDESKTAFVNEEVFENEVDDIASVSKADSINEITTEYEARALRAEEELVVFKKQLEDLKSESSQKGYKEGFDEGKEIAINETKEKNKLLSKIIDDLETQKCSLDHEHETAAIEVAYAALVKIIGKKLADKETLVAIIKQISSELSYVDSLVIHLSRSDYVMLQDDNEIIELFKDKHMKMVVDERVTIGGCIIESTGASLDGRLEVQFQLLKDALLNARALAAAEI